ncbi:MAG: C39 family peptidase [Patescibacteria group bacterium]
MRQDSKKILTITGLTLTIAAGWLVYGVRYDALDAYRAWRRGPIPVAVGRLEFNRAVSGVPTAQAEEEIIVDLVVEPAADQTDNATTIAEPDDENQSEPDSVPEPVTETTATESTIDERPFDLAETINLRVPFMIQAPQQNWDELHGEACEEASSIMLAAYYNDEAEITVEEAEARIMDAVTYEAETLGYHLDTTADETVQMLREHFEIAGATVVEIDSIDDIRERLNAGHPVIVPAYGKALGNPNFRNGGPLYHMLVIKGYTATHFITNDPGTRRGADYIYDFDTLFSAIHDWNGGDVPNGRKVMITAK